jgi:hypothetical protein
MSGPPDFYAALPAQGLDAPHKLAASHIPSVGQKCPEGNFLSDPCSSVANFLFLIHPETQEPISRG